MRALVLLLLCSLAGHAWTFKVIKVPMNKGKKYKKLKAITTGEVSGSIITDCDCYQNDNCNELLYAFNGINPESTDEKKTELIRRMDEMIEELSVLKNCNHVKTMCISFVEGTFIKVSDNLNPAEFWKKPKGHKLDIKRFLDRYENQLEEYLPNTTIYLTIQGW